MMFIFDKIHKYVLIRCFFTIKLGYIKKKISNFGDENVVYHKRYKQI